MHCYVSCVTGSNVRTKIDGLSNIVRHQAIAVICWQAIVTEYGYVVVETVMKLKKSQLAPFVELAASTIATEKQQTRISRLPVVD